MSPFQVHEVFKVEYISMCPTFVHKNGYANKKLEVCLQYTLSMIENLRTIINIIFSGIEVVIIILL